MSVLHQNLIRALRDAGPDGLSEGDMAQAGGRWWKRHVTDINRWKLAVIGWEERDGEKRYFDASGVEQAGDTSGGSRGGEGGYSLPSLPVSSPLNIEAERLFDPPKRSHYETEREAA